MSTKTELLIELERVKDELKRVAFLSSKWQELDKRETYILNAINGLL